MKSFWSHSISRANITEEVPDGPIRDYLQKDPSLTSLEVPLEKLLAISLQLSLGIHKLSRSNVGSKLANLKPSQILFHLDGSLKSEWRSCWGITNRNLIIHLQTLDLLPSQRLIWERVLVAHLGSQSYKQMNINCIIVCKFTINWRVFCTVDCHIGISTISIVSGLSKVLAVFK